MSERELLNEKQVANMLGFKVETLRNQRSLGKAKIPYVKINRSVRYFENDVKTFIDQNRHFPERERGEHGN